MKHGVWKMVCAASLLPMSLVVGCSETRSGEMTSTGGVVAMHGAICTIQPTEGSRCRGVVSFTEVAGGVRVLGEFEGLTPGQRHGFHIHEYAFSGSGDATCTGGHYDPAGTGHHALPGSTAAHHAGDMGNLVADGRGRARYDAVLKGVSLTGKNAIVGRAVIVHGQRDDGGQPTGNAGSRIGVGTIGIAPPEGHH